MIPAVLTSSFEAQPRWGEITPKGCTGNGLREWSGILWDIPWGESWDTACRNLPAVGGGRRPDDCVTKTNVWGIWRVPDRECFESGAREDRPLVFELLAFNGTPDRVVRIEYVVEHDDLVDPYTAASSPDKGTYPLVARARQTARTRIEFPYEGGPWILRVRAWVMGGGAPIPLDEQRREIYVSFDPAEPYDDFIEFGVYPTSSGGYVMRRSGRR